MNSIHLPNRLRASIKVIRFLTVTACITALMLGILGQLLRDITLNISYLSYIPLLPVAFAAFAIDLVLRGKAIKQRRFALSALAGLGLLVIFSTMKGWAWLQPAPIVANITDTPIKLLHWNVRWGASGKWAELTQQIRAQAADIIVISEIPSYWEINELQQHLSSISENTWSVFIQPPLAIYSRYPMQQMAAPLFKNGMGILVTIQLPHLPHQVLRLLAIDGKRDLSQPRDLLLNDIHTYLQKATQHGQSIHIIVGDFNSLGRSRGFDAWVEDGYQLASRRLGYWRGTWPSWLPLYDIDHIWLDPHLQPLTLDFLSHQQADHRGQSLNFALTTPVLLPPASP